MWSFARLERKLAPFTPDSHTMKRSQSKAGRWVIAWTLIAVMFGLLAGCGENAGQVATQLLQTEAATITRSPTSEPTATRTPSPTPSNTQTPTPTPACGGPPVMIVLGIGTDSRSNNYLYGLADVIRVVRIDFVNLEASVLAIPRALYVQIPEISDHGVTAGLLNQAYFYGTEGMGYYDHPSAGAGLLARTLQANFGLSVDHYVVMNMTVFRYLIDELGGIYVTVPYNMDGRPRPSDPMQPEHFYFLGGRNYFRGEAALAYARLRKVDSIFGRQMRQSDILLAMRERVLDPDFISKVPQAIDYYYGLIRTDLSLEQLYQLFCVGQLIPQESISFVGWPADFFGDAYTPQGLLYLDVDMDVISADIAMFALGRWGETMEDLVPVR